ncbi:hypothetical protein NOCARDAX2BIS_80032 [Nocardioides sp. AX2bis]|nr:hypothetical protein NOCARDAX2BIS_80032 [Nocardioides sp. AX2bis]
MPGHPEFLRYVEAAFWTEIANGLLSIETATAVGATRAVGQRWFHHADDGAPFDLKLKPMSHSQVTQQSCYCYPSRDGGWSQVSEPPRDPGMFKSPQRCDRRLTRT